MKAFLVVCVLGAAACAQSGGGASTGGAAGSAANGGTGGAPPCMPGDMQCDATNCGAPHHDCLGGACLAGVCEPVALAGHVGVPLATSSHAIFGLHVGKAAGPEACRPAYVFRVPDSGGPAAEFLSARADYLATNGSYLYLWQPKSSPCEQSSVETLSRVRLAGGAAEEIRTDPLGGGALRFHGDSIYQLALLSDGRSQFVTYPADGGSVVAIGVPIVDGAPSFIGMDEAWFYWWGQVDAEVGAIRAMPIDGGAVRTIAQGHDVEWPVVTDDESAYYATVDPQTRFTSMTRVPLAGGPRELLYQNNAGQNLPLRVVGNELMSSAERAADGHESLVAIPRTGGAPRTVLDGYGVSELLADDTALYFVGGTGGQDNTLYRLAR